MTPQETHISVIDPISPAIERVKIILFRPFTLGKWFVIGFCAWLAFLGEGGGPNFNFNFGGSQRGGGLPADTVNHVKDYVVANLFWIIPAAVILFLLLIAIGFLITWLSSRGHFMFLHCVALNKAEIKVPWRKFKNQGNSLFLFRIVVGLIAFTVITLLIALLVVIGILLFADRGPHLLGIILMVLLALCLIVPTAIVFALIDKFTKDFVVPIMALQETKCIAAWREFWKLLTGNKGKFTLYILFQIVIAMAVGIIGASVACLFACLFICFTCGIGACLMILPPFSLGFGYIITVLLLPLSVFSRSYSLLYLRQYGTDFDVFIPEVETEAG